MTFNFVFRIVNPSKARSNHSLYYSFIYHSLFNQNRRGFRPGPRSWKVRPVQRLRVLAGTGNPPGPGRTLAVENIRRGVGVPARGDHEEAAGRDALGARPPPALGIEQAAAGRLRRRSAGNSIGQAEDLFEDPRNPGLRFTPRISRAGGTGCRMETVSPPQHEWTPHDSISSQRVPPRGGFLQAASGPHRGDSRRHRAAARHRRWRLGLGRDPDRNA